VTSPDLRYAIDLKHKFSPSGGLHWTAAIVARPPPVTTAQMLCAEANPSLG
jgi:hypothetical protein